MFLTISKYCHKPSGGKILLFSLLACYIIVSSSAFDDDDDDVTTTPTHNQENLPKDKILLKSIKTLTFHRNKRTTSRRTHSIHQLSCVGGTAGCKLFTPNVVECENAGFIEGKIKFDWRCHADVSNRVKFNHVEVICEGYDYPEDDYILLGSCGLEFTLDYADPSDHHHQSYFKHMDEHEKELHQRRIGTKQSPSSGLSQFFGFVSGQFYLICSFIILSLCSFLLVRFLATGQRGRTIKATKRPNSYGPLTSAVLTTKKAC